MIFLGLFSLLLDLTICNFLNCSSFNISLFFPYLTIVYLIFNFYYNKKINAYYIYLIIFLYAVIINNNIALTILLFSLLYFFINFIKKYLKDNIISYFIVILLSIFIYDFASFLFFSSIGYLEFNVFLFLYKIVNSILLNLFYGAFLYFIISVLKYKRR